MQLNKVHSFLMCAGYLYLLPMFMASKYQETGLPLLYTMDINIIVEYHAPSLIQCSIGCVSKGCLALLFKSDDFVDDQHCYQTASHDEYTGTVSETISGRVCQNWAEHTPHYHWIYANMTPENSLIAAKNYCRDPDGTGYNWCFTLDPSVRWEFCDIGRCMATDNNCRLYNKTGSPSDYRTGYRYYNMSEP